jgi:hypothetical protein
LLPRWITCCGTSIIGTFGFHRRSSVLNIDGAGIHSAAVKYDENLIRERSRMIDYAIDARRQRYPSETSYVYKPLADNQDDYQWNDTAKSNIKDYNAIDLSI